jgi:hypothetical protein
VWQKTEVMPRNPKCHLPLFLLTLAALFAVNITFAQESSSVTNSSAPAPIAANSPAAALRDTLSAACSQSQADFARFLTARSKEAFTRMTPTARIALMKRIVLLAEPGKATVSTNPAGRPIVRCQTPAVATEMQIGGAELRDNLAFLPMELREATDSAGANVRQINMGFVREDGQWKLLSLGLLLLDLPSLELEWDTAQVEDTERRAVDVMKKIAEAVEAYRRKFSRLPESLTELGPPVHGAANAEAAGLLDAELATGMSNGYTFRYVIVGANTLGAPAKYEIAATPIHYGRTGRRSFFRDSSGALHAADRQGAIGSEADPKLE